MDTHPFDADYAKKVPLWEPLMPLIDELQMTRNSDASTTFTAPNNCQFWLNADGVRIWHAYPYGRCYSLSNSVPIDIVIAAFRYSAACPIPVQPSLTSIVE